MVSKPFGTIRQIGMGGLQLHSTRSAITDVVGEHVSAGFTGLSRAGQLRLRWGQETKLKNVASIRPIHSQDGKYHSRIDFSKRFGTSLSPNNILGAYEKHAVYFQVPSTTIVLFPLSCCVHQLTLGY